LNPLCLYGFGTQLSVKDRRLVVREGRFSPLSYTRYSSGQFREPKVMKFKPRQIPYDSIIVEGSSGMITFDAMRWLMHHNTPLFMLDYDGSLIAATMPPQPIRGDLHRAQVETHLDQTKRLAIARALIRAKLDRSGEVLDWVQETYDVERDVRRFKKEAANLGIARTVDDVRTVEGRSAEFYWLAFQETVPSKLEFKGRSNKARNRHYNANDPVNALLNYGYAFLQSSVRRAVNATGLDASVGFIHEDKPSTTPLVYDLQEPFRWLVDFTVLNMIQSKMFSWNDFYFAEDDYRLRIKPLLLDSYAELLRERFNSGVVYGGDRIQWDTVILRKCQELARYLTGRSSRLDMLSPEPDLERLDSRRLREKILSISTREARRVGLRKSTLHDLRKHARERKPFKVYSSSIEKLSRVDAG